MSRTIITPAVDTEEWKQAAEKGKEAAGNVGQMASHASSAVSEMVEQAACNVSEKADELAANAGVRIQEMGARFRNNAPRTGALAAASEAVAETVRGGGEYLEDAKLTGMVEDFAKMIRRNPIPAICIAMGLGWFVGRKLKA